MLLDSKEIFLIFLSNKEKLSTILFCSFIGGKGIKVLFALIIVYVLTVVPSVLAKCFFKKLDWNNNWMKYGLISQLFDKQIMFPSL